MKVEDKSIKVADCPLCGESAFLHQDNSIFNKPRFWIKCDNLDCGCTLNSTDDQRLALANWNRRA